MMSIPFTPVAIHGAPRSGTTWLGQLFNSSEYVAYRYQPLFSYAFRDRIHASSNAAEIERFLHEMASTTDDFVLQRGASRLAAESPAFRKRTATHLVYKEVRFHHLLPILLKEIPISRAICIVRDPRAVIASWVRAPREFDSAWSIDTEWRLAEKKNAGLEENWYGYDRWKQLACLFEELCHQFPLRARIVCYEDLVANPDQVVRELFDLAGLHVGAQTSDFIRASASFDDGDPYGVFRANAGQANWRGLVPEHVDLEIQEDLRGTALGRFLRA